MRLTAALLLILFQVEALADTLSGRVVRVTDSDTIVIPSLGPQAMRYTELLLRIHSENDGILRTLRDLADLNLTEDRYVYALTLEELSAELGGGIASIGLAGVALSLIHI